MFPPSAAISARQHWRMPRLRAAHTKRFGFALSQSPNVRAYSRAIALCPYVVRLENTRSRPKETRDARRDMRARWPKDNERVFARFLRTPLDDVLLAQNVEDRFEDFFFRFLRVHRNQFSAFSAWNKCGDLKKNIKAKAPHILNNVSVRSFSFYFLFFARLLFLSIQFLRIFSISNSGLFPILQTWKF